MHKFALFFMLALTMSMVAVLSESVFAEEMTGDVAEQTTTEDTATTDATDESVTADSSDSMETTAMETHVDSPLKQLSMGVDPHQIQCDSGHKLVFRANNWHPSCVKESSFQTLSEWGWIANHDPSSDELAMMIQDHMAKYPKESDNGNTNMEENMDVTDGSSTTNSTNTDNPTPQSHTIDLSESMEMGAQ